MIEQAWVDHLQNMEHLRDGIGLRGYGQRDPKNEYKKEGFNLFLNMMASISSKVLTRLFETKMVTAEQLAQMERATLAQNHQELDQAVARHPGEGGEADLEAKMRSVAAASSAAKQEPPLVARNELCPCGSGKKFKQCHGALVDD
jgi:preprotein translocase subunit SecA